MYYLFANIPGIRVIENPMGASSSFQVEKKCGHLKSHMEDGQLVFAFIVITRHSFILQLGYFPS